MLERRTEERADGAGSVGETGDEVGEVGTGGEVGEAGRETGGAGAGARFNLGRVYRPAAYALLAAAAALLLLRQLNAAFLVGALGLSAWFLDVRNRLIRKHDLVKVGGRNWRPRREVEAEERRAAEDAED